MVDQAKLDEREGLILNKVKSSLALINGTKQMSLILSRLGIFILWAIIPLAYVVQGQDTNWDLQNYHLYNTISLFEGSFRADTAPAGIQSYFNPLVSVPAYWIHRIARTPSQSFWAGLALAAFQGLCGPLVYGIAKTLLQVSKQGAFLIAAYGISGSILLSEAGTSFGDLTLCVLQLVAVYLSCLSLRAKETSKQNLLSTSWGLLGSACGIKFSSIFLFPLLIMITLASLKHREKSFSFLGLAKEIVYLTVLPFLIGLVLFGWLWFSRSWIENGNPFYPLFSSLFGESPIFLIDNHADTRFLTKGLRGFLLAPFMEFMAVPMQRAEMAYRDLRPMLWVYGGALSLIGLVAVNLRKGFKHILTDESFTALGWVSFQIGMLASYGIWLKSAGIARYSLSFQSLSGISLWISFCILAYLSRLPAHNSNLTAPLDPVRRRAVALGFAGLLAICVSTEVIPNWGRTTFTHSWNSLQLFDGRNGEASEKNWIKQGHLFPKDQPVVLMEQPLGWLKQYAARDTSFNLISGNLRPASIRRIKGIIQEHNGRFTAVAFVDSKLLKPHTVISALDGRLQFKTESCADFITPTGIKLRNCQATLDGVA